MFHPKENLKTALLTAGALALPATGMAGSISPDNFSATIDVGETVSVDKTITRSSGGSTKTDVFFMSDNTGSMRGTINTAQDRADDIINAPEFDDDDIGFGVGAYNGDPKAESLDAGEAYSTLQQVTTNDSDVTDGLNAWQASGGGDAPEGNLFGLQQAATGGADTEDGVGTGDSTGWRSGAQRIVAWFGDQPGHQETVTLPESIQALKDAGVTVLGFNDQFSGDGIDDVEDSSTDARNQASAVTNATDGELVNDFQSKSSNEFVDAIVDNIDSTTEELDLIFETSGLGSAVDVSFSCTDPAGCDNVAAGESRDFRVDFTGVAPGTESFGVSARGIDATEKDRIRVTSADVPTPSSLLLLGGGLLGFGAAARRRRQS